MLRKIIATTAVLTMVAAASATINASHSMTGSGLLPDGVTPYETWQVSLNVADGPTAGDPDDWTASAISTTSALTGGTFYQVPATQLGGDVAPNPLLFGGFPNLPFDTFYGDPLAYPNAGGVAGSASFAAGPADTATTLSADWFDLVDTGNGDFVVLQITVVPTGSYNASFLLQYAGANTSGNLFDYNFTIPEPASLSLLGLGALALIRRR